MPNSSLGILYFSSTSLWHDAPFPAFRLFPFTGFSFLFSNSCPFFPHVFITFLSCYCQCLYLFHFVASPPQHPSLFIWSSYPLLSFPLPPALVDWARDLCHDLRSGGARLWAHRDYKQLPHSDKVMDHKIKNAWHWPTQSLLSFTPRGLYIHTEIACSAAITVGQDEIPDDLQTPCCQKQNQRSQLLQLSLMITWAAKTSQPHKIMIFRSY